MGKKSARNLPFLWIVTGTLFLINKGRKIVYEIIDINTYENFVDLLIVLTKQFSLSEVFHNVNQDSIKLTTMERNHLQCFCHSDIYTAHVPWGPVNYPLVPLDCRNYHPVCFGSHKVCRGRPSRGRLYG
jgi:hypothetical protein